MKRKLYLFLLLSLLVCLMIPSHADTVDEVDEPCSHGTFIRITEPEKRCVADGDGLHRKETCFFAWCAECGDYEVEIISESVLEPHNYVLTREECKSAYHTYVFTCEDCGHEVVGQMPCAGNHPNDE